MARCWLSLGRQSHGWDGEPNSIAKVGKDDKTDPETDTQEGTDKKQSHGRWQARDSGRWAAFQIHPLTLAKVLFFLLDID